MFEWDNLPETVDQRFLEATLLLNGKIAFTKLGDKFYVFSGNWGGEPNCYYQPTIWTVANPILGSHQLRIRNMDGSDDVNELDAILLGNSDFDLLSSNCEVGGLYNLIYQTAGLLADNISSLNVAQINGRVSTIFTADSQAEAATAEDTLQSIYSGKPYKVLSQNILEKIGVNPIAATGQSNTLMTLIEAHQYILAQFFNEIGVGGNWNMKRERINTAETELMTDSLDINIQSMLKCREDAVEKINKKYGLNIEVKLNETIYKEEEDLINEAQSDSEAQIDGIKEDKVEIKEENEQEKEVK